MAPYQTYNKLIAQKVIKELQSRNIDGFYFDIREEALKKVLEIIPEGSSVSWGGSVTLNETGLIDSLKNSGYNLLDPNAVQGGQAKDKIAHQALNADYYLMSTNAISATGELVNLDGIGNRVSALSFGPKNVIIIAGINKIEHDLDSAILRAKTKVAPLVVLSYGKGEISSYEELLKEAQAAYSQVVITTKSIFKDRIKVILIGESLGF